MAKKKTNSKKSGGGKWQLFGIVGVLMAVVFMPTTILLFFAMIPTVAAAFSDRSGRGTKALTVGSMNLAGAFPFLISLWSKTNDAELALDIATNPQNIIIMWGAAGVGYLIDYSMSGIISTMLVQRSDVRIKDIKKRQADLIERWGREVTGEIPMDQFGFPLQPDDITKDGNKKGVKNKNQ